MALFLAARLLPAAINRVQWTDPTGRLLVATLVLLGGAFLGQAVGMLVGGRLNMIIPIGPLRSVDRVVGALLGLVGIAVAVWVLLPSIAGVAGWPARQARSSSLARFVDRNFPAPPDTLQALRRLVGNNTFPEVFSALEPSLNTGPPPADSGLSAGSPGRRRRLDGQGGR